MLADGINYKDVLVIAKVIDGQLDFPFPIFSFTAVENGHIHYDVSEIPDGTEVLAHVHVKTSDYDNALLLPGVVQDFQNDERVRNYWTTTKAEYYGVQTDEASIS